MFFLFLLSFLSCETVETKMDKKEILESKVVLRIESENRAFYSYPRSDMFRSGDFDIKSVEVRDLNDSYVLILEVGSAFTNNLSLPGGWDKQVFDVYFFTNVENHHQALKDRRVVFKEAWEKSVLVSPVSRASLRKEVMKVHSEVYDDTSEIENLSSDIFVPNTIRVYDNKIYVKLPKNEFESVMKRLKGLQIFVLNLDAYPVNGASIKKVEQYSTYTSFGGGSYSDSHPNVINMLGDVDDLNNFEDDITRIVFSRVGYVEVTRED